MAADPRIKAERTAKDALAEAKRRSPIVLAGRRLAISVVGVTLLVVGIALLVLPGPGLLVIMLGLAVLAKEFDSANRLLDKAKERIGRIKAEREKSKTQDARTGE